MFENHHLEKDGQRTNQPCPGQSKSWKHETTKRPTLKPPTNFETTIAQSSRMVKKSQMISIQQITWGPHHLYVTTLLLILAKKWCLFDIPMEMSS